MWVSIVAGVLQLAIPFVGWLLKLSNAKEASLSAFYAFVKENESERAAIAKARDAAKTQDGELDKLAAKPVNPPT